MKEKHTPTEKRLAWLKIALFFVMLGAPLVWWLGAHPPLAAISVVENRGLAPVPRWRPANVPGMVKDLDAFLQDHFPGREYLIRLDLALAMSIRGYTKESLLGREGHLFYFPSIKNTYGLTPFPAWTADRVLERQAFFRRHGIPYLFVLLPDKQSVYPEFLPHALPEGLPSTSGDRLLDALRREGVETLDARELLRQDKAKGALFNVWADTTHWNGRGLLCAYEHMRDKLAVWFPHIHPLSGRVPYELEETSEQVSLALDFNGCRKETLPYMETFRKRRSNWTGLDRLVNPAGEGSLLILSDSYLKYSFAKSNIAGLHATPTPLLYHFNVYRHMHYEWASLDTLSILVDAEKPDVVVEAWCERALK